MTPVTMLPALLWWLLWTRSCSKPSDIVDDVADDEEEPARNGQVYGHHFAHRIVFGVLGVLPEEPIGRKQHQPDRGDMLLEIEKALRLPIAHLLDRYPDIDAILGVDPRAHDERQDPQDAHRRGIGRSGHGAEARDEAR